MSATLASVLVLFLAPAPAGSVAIESDAFERRLVSVPGLSVGIMSATQGAYTTRQMVLDMTQGARVADSAYSPATPPRLSLSAGGQVSPWRAAVARAHDAPQLLQPGLLAGQLPQGAAYAAPGRQPSVDGVLAADTAGQVATVSLGPPATLLKRIERLASSRQLVVADLPAGALGYADLRDLALARAPRELLVAVQRASDTRGHELLWAGFAGLQPRGLARSKTITSQTTNQRGLIAAVDIAPTILVHLDRAVPADMRGKLVRLDGALDGAYLRGLKARLGVISGRRLPALGWLAMAWALLLAGAHAARHLRGPRGTAQHAREPRETARHGEEPREGGRQREAWAMRMGALALLWAPAAMLATAALEPSRTAEFGLLVAICFGLGALSDRLAGWPRAPLAPAVVAVVAIVVDALAGTQLLMRSLLGPDPALGARFYGIGNELKSVLAVTVLCGAAAALYPGARGRRAALGLAAAGAALAVVEGSARIGAGVGGVVLVSAGTAVAVAMALPGALTRRRVLTVMIVPALGLVALAGIDLATAHGSGHFTGSVLHARSAGDVRDILVRRYGAAWDELRNHLMPLATALAVAGGALGVARRERLAEPVGGDPVWIAALCGGLAAGVVGALTEDSGPVLLVAAVGALGCVLAYLWGKPARPVRPAQTSLAHQADAAQSAQADPV